MKIKSNTIYTTLRYNKVSYNKKKEDVFEKLLI